MNDKRAEFLGRIRTKLPHSLLPQASPDHPGSFQGYSYLRADLSTEGLIKRFTQELEALSGHVHRLTDIEQVIPTILNILQQHQASQIIAWDDASLEIPWLRQGLVEAGIAIAASELSPEDIVRKARL